MPSLTLAKLDRMLQQRGVALATVMLTFHLGQTQGTLSCTCKDADHLVLRMLQPQLRRTKRHALSILRALVKKAFLMTLALD